MPFNWQLSELSHGPDWLCLSERSCLSRSGRVSQTDEQTGTRVRQNMVPAPGTTVSTRWGRALLTLQIGRVESRQKSCEYGGANSQNLRLSEEGS